MISAEALLYLLLFAALWALHRNRPVSAAALMVASVLTHEIALLTVVPVFGAVLLRKVPFRKACAVLAPSAAAGLVVLTVPPADTGAVQIFQQVLADAGFPHRDDALGLFDRTQAQSWQLYSITDVLLYLLPLAAVVTPVLLAFGGWDEARWGFLLVTNFVLVLWLWQGRRELHLHLFGALAAILLVLTHLPLPYFDGYRPRDITLVGTPHPGGNITFSGAGLNVRRDALPSRALSSTRGNARTRTFEGTAQRGIVCQAVIRALIMRTSAAAATRATAATVSTARMTTASSVRRAPIVDSTWFVRKAAHHQETSSAPGVGYSDPVPRGRSGLLAFQTSRTTICGNQKLTIGTIQPSTTHLGECRCRAGSITSALARASHSHRMKTIPVTTWMPRSIQPTANQTESGKAPHSPATFARPAAVLTMIRIADALRHPASGRTRGIGLSGTGA